MDGRAGTLAAMSQTFRMPDLGEGLTEATVVAWHVRVGDTIEVDQLLVEIDTGKTVVEIPSPFSGTITSIMAKEGETVDVEAILYIVDGDPTVAPPAPEAAANTPKATQEPAMQTSATDRARAMPIVRKLAKEAGVDLVTVAGSGPGGAITRADVLSASSNATSSEMDSARTDTRDRVALSQTRRAIADHMSKSWASIPHVTVQAELRAEALLAARSERAEGHYPVETLIAQAVVPLLQEFPEFNSAFAGGDMLHSSAVHLGFAVDTEAGLIVIVVKDAHDMDSDTLAYEFERLSKAAQERRIGLDEISGQTFTISNIGALGGGHGTPIIPLGTSAIMSIGRATQQPVVEDGELAVGLVAPVDLSYDHRLIDGALGQRFLSVVVTALER